ncbi:phospholipase A1 PLIP2, chloroplastic-like [Hibiscus syriacus]|uniref:phospholipase A1 PLIP2, chloroplastic-like n=1 Tax=Hibiscus syriacus TaxID=106335 RepID=UPI0019218F88|nr:phospholipase A1 PLIP2, chloroplastic-like [Hibiscus syriacus]
MDGLCLKTGIHGMPPAISVIGPLKNRTNASQVSAVARSFVDNNKSTALSRLSCRCRLKSLWPGAGNDTRHNGMAVDDTVLLVGDNGEEEKVNAGNGNVGEMNGTSEGQNGNWVMKILDVKALWRENDEEGKKSVGKEGESEEENNENGDVNEDEEICEFCCVCDDDDDDENEMKKIEMDKHSFSKMLKRVSLADAKLYAQMSYLGCLAYMIPKIKPESLLRVHGLRLVTSSIEKRESAMKVEKNHEQIVVSSENQEEQRNKKGDAAGHEQKNIGHRISASAAYQIAASAASYLQSHTRTILPFKSSNPESIKGLSQDGSDMINSDVASLMATTDSVTAVVAAKEEVKQAVADDLNSTHSLPCEWFICDDDQSTTRLFVIQGSGSLASWQANLLFEPIQFEGLDVLVHRGIYEASKGIYEQMLPEVRSHLKCYGNRATFRFTGHSLGGSLSLLVSLMLLIRGEVPASSLLPIIMFGSPSIMCGGDRLFRQLGLPQSHVQAITMHRDIVPRAFSCDFPDHVAELLKAINGKLRHHPCLNNQKILYAPMGQLLILQPDEKFSPHHHLLPSGTGLYFLSCPLSNKDDEEKLFRAALRIFFNSPHPLDILSDRSAYGSEGTILRDHDMKSYLKSIRNVIRQEQNRIRKKKREQRRKDGWSVVFPSSINSSIILEGAMVTIGSGQELFNLASVLQSGRASLKRFGKLVASGHMHLLVILLFPAKLLLLGAYHVIGFR